MDRDVYLSDCTVVLFTVGMFLKAEMPHYCVSKKMCADSLRRDVSMRTASEDNLLY